ncbi:hypothetical protein FRC00_005351 [Tulasnella sp. 408]|nr:hypothetical protein FRC00_005351 [Tulasnella sp. 408]
MTEMPDLPKEFGEDGGHFYQHYDKLAEESDEELVKNLKAQLDGILIFAGLFAGVNSTFLVFTLPQLSANPADDTNALLLQIARGDNSSITSTADLPSASFIPSHRIYLVNVLFSVSLILALFSALLAVFGQQWIVYYRKRGAGGAEDRRWEQLQRYLRAKRWRLELVLDDLVPSLLQIGLVIFCIAFALHLGTLSKPLSHIIARLLYVAAAIIVAMATCAALDPWCPFKQPLSRIVTSVACAAIAFAVVVLLLGFVLLYHGIMAACVAMWPTSPFVAAMQGNLPRGVLESIGMVISVFGDVYRSLMLAGIRSAKDPDDLKIKIEALKRVMVASEDHDALIYAARNLQVLQDGRAMSSLAKNQEFCRRLYRLQLAAIRETQDGRSSNRYSLILSKSLSTSYFHFIFTTSSDPYIRGMDNGLSIQVLPRVPIQSEEMRHLLEGSVLSLNASCDQCSHCATLLLSIRVAYIILESAKDRSIPDLHTSFKNVLGTSAENHDLRLGFMAASVILISRQLNDEEWATLTYQPHKMFLTALFAAYREKSERQMFGTISRALATVSAQWRGKPDHEIYVWLFELYLLPGRKGISEFDQRLVLEDLDHHLLSLENRIREEGASEIDRQRGRDYQNRYVQLIARFCAAQDSSQDPWAWIGAPMERYLWSVAELMETDPGHPENPRTMVGLRYMKSSLPAPELPEGSQDNVWYKTKYERQKKAYSTLCQLVNDVESIRGRKLYQDTGFRYQRLFCIQQHGRMWGNQQEPAIHMSVI